MKPFYILTLFLSLLSGLSACAPAPKKELLIYCGITMIRPMREIADIIEKQEDIKVIIIKGGSGNLLRSIEINGVGIIYADFLPALAHSFVDLSGDRDF